MAWPWPGIKYQSTPKLGLVDKNPGKNSTCKNSVSGIFFQI